MQPIYSTKSISPTHAGPEFALNHKAGQTPAVTGNFAFISNLP
jgi:hypothetical protein